LNQNQERAVSDVFNFLWNKTNNGHLDDILMNRAETFGAESSPIIWDSKKGQLIDPPMFTVWIGNDTEHFETFEEALEFAKNDIEEDEEAQITISYYKTLNAETFETQYAGVGSLMDIGKGTSIGSFSPEELTESSAIHGDFDSASLNYSGNQNIVSRAEGEESNFGSVGEGNNFGQMRAEGDGADMKTYEAYDDKISERQEYLIGKLGGKSNSDMTRSQASDLIKKLQGKRSGTWRAEEPVIEEPDFIPDGDGRALGQQTSSINLSPLHAESKVLSKTNLVIAGVIGLGLWKGKQILDTAKSSLKQSAENKKKGCSTCNSNGTVRKNHTQVKQSEYSVNQINPVEAEGQSDIHGAEGVTNPRHAPSSQPFGYPSKSLKMW
jgi:hypothetical protein